MTYESPLYWKEMKKIRKALEKAQASGFKQQAIDETVPYNDIEEAQAPSFKRQARRATSNKRQATSTKGQAPSHKRQAP